MHSRKWLGWVGGLCVVLAGSTAWAADMGTAFTYQGAIEKPAGSPYSGTCDFKFGLWDASVGGALVPPGVLATNPTLALAVAVSGGIFTTTMDFGEGAINGQARWLAIEVRCPAGAGPYSLLTPRVALTPAPHALVAGLAWRLPELYTQPGGLDQFGYYVWPSITGGSGNHVGAGVVGATVFGGGGYSERTV